MEMVSINNIAIVIIFVIIVYAVSRWQLHKMAVIHLLKSKAELPLVFKDGSGNIILQIGNERNDAPVAIIHNESVFWTRVMLDTDVGLGETYMECVWTSPDITLFLRNLYHNFRDSAGDETIWTRGLSKLGGMAKVVCFSSKKDKERIQSHYDIGNDFYDQFLKESALKAYTCGFFTNNECTLDEAQKNKVDLIINKLGIKTGHRILDIGCGWGNIANYISEKTGAHVVGLTISDEQIRYIRDTFDEKSVSVINKDWRELISPEYEEEFDGVYSIGMLEHVRYENYGEYFRAVNSVLKPEGRAVIHSISSPTNTPKQSVENGTFITKHIFPGGQIPMHDWITNETVGISGFKLSHSECFGGHHYARTCREWRNLLLSSPELSKYSDELVRKFDYYFASCDAAFSVGLMALGHYVFIKHDSTPVDFDNQYFPEGVLQTSQSI